MSSSMILNFNKVMKQIVDTNKETRYNGSKFL